MKTCQASQRGWIRNRHTGPAFAGSAAPGAAASGATRSGAALSVPAAFSMP